MFNNNLYPRGFDGIILNIDSKSVNGLANLGDAVVDRYVGKFEAKWNQISYEPPLLTLALSSHNIVVKKRYEVLNQSYLIGVLNYYTVSIFVCDLVYFTSQLNLFTMPINQISGGSFGHIMMLVCIPNGVLKHRYYDQFFDKGKEGYDTSIKPRVPKDTRFKIKSKSNFLEFRNLPALCYPKRYCHFPPSPQTLTTINLDNQLNYVNHQIRIP